MDKAILNTEIVSMRHDIRRARVHTINKLVRTSRKLKIKNGSEKEREKYQRKASRFMEEISIMKSLKDDEISKFALTSLKPPGDILNDPKIPLRDKALARLSGHPIVTARVCQFRTKFPSWKDTIVTLLKQLGTKKKKKKKNTKTKEHLQKTISLKDNSESVNNSSLNISDLETSQNVSSSSPEIISRTSKSKTVKVKRKRKEFETDNSDISSSKGKVPGSNLAEVKRFSEMLKANIENDNKSSEEDTANVDSINDKNKIVNDVLEDKTVDLFFVCEDGKTGYVTNVKRTCDENGHLGERSKKTVEWSSQKRDNRDGFGRKTRRYGQVLEPKNFNIKSSDHKFGNKSKNSQGQKTERADHRKKIQTEANDSIHPSWEAKKRLKEQQHAVSAFQGKKIKFED